MASFRSLAIVLATFLIASVITDRAFVTMFPSLHRLTTNFSSAYLQREIVTMSAEPPGIVFSGDSVLWGYRLPVGVTTAGIMRERGYPIRNLAFEGGSPANTYAVLRLLVNAGIRPRLFVFNVNQKEFNPADSAYNTLHPALQESVQPIMSESDLALLSRKPVAQTVDARIDRAVSATFALYGMRADLRETLFGDVDAIHALDRLVKSISGAAAKEESEHVPTRDKFEGTYALDKLDKDNVSMHFLAETIALLQANHQPALAILTPTNHRLLHEYIDVPQYAANLSSTSRMLEAGGIRVLDCDRRFRASEFLDNDHLTAAGNRKLAALIEPNIPR